MIAVRSLAYAYPEAGRPALRGLDFRVERGEIFALLGPGGSGKTTAWKILAGLIREYAGTAAFLDRELRDWSRDFYERIGVSFQAPNHFLKLTALENLAYFGSLYAGKSGPDAGLDGTESLPGLLEKVGLSQDGHKPVGRFTREMRNRLSLARALLHRPEALFLDEPLAGQDPAHAGSLKALIRAQSRAGRAVFLTTRDADLAEDIGDRVALLSEGRILAMGRPRDLKVQFPGSTLAEAFLRLTARSPS